MYTIPIPARTHFLQVPNMEPYIEFRGTLQNSGFWLVKIYSVHIDIIHICI